MCFKDRPIHKIQYLIKFFLLKFLGLWPRPYIARGSSSYRPQVFCTLRPLSIFPYCPTYVGNQFYPDVAPRADSGRV